MYKIFIVEDDAVIASNILGQLQRWGFSGAIAEDLQDVLGEFRRFSPHLVLMDISLPFYNGFYWCTQLRRESNVPIVFLSSQNDDMDIVMAVQMGADDYITKPFSMDVLIAKIQAVLRRSYDYEATMPLVFQNMALDPSASCLRQGESRIELTKNEMRILQLLLQNKGHIVSREQLMLKLWDDDAFVDDNTLTVNVNRLRKKLETAGIKDAIVTHKGQGYAIYE